MTLLKSLLLIVAAIFVCHEATAQSNVPSQDIVGFYQFRFAPGAPLAPQSESNGMAWADAGPDGPQITINSNSLSVQGLAAPAGNKARLSGVDGRAARIGLGTNVASGTIYYSLALQVTDLGMRGTNGGVLAALNNATGGV
jgi:hypothetical protein